MKKWVMMTALIILGIMALAAGDILLFHSYHDQNSKNKDLDHDGIINVMDPDMDGDGIPNLEDPDANGDRISNKIQLVTTAKQIAGTLYDPLKGGHANIGGKLGFIVCIDVPRLAYEKAGISFQQLLTDDFNQHPEHYDTEGGMNTPNTPFFFRRVRNVYDYAKGNNSLIRKAKIPKVGDIVFYSRYHATLVIQVYKDGTYDEVEAHPRYLFTVEHHHKKWAPKDVARLLN